MKTRRAFGVTLLCLGALMMLWQGYNLTVGGMNRVTGALMLAASVCVPLISGAVLTALSFDAAAARRRVVRGVLIALFCFYLAALALSLFISRIDFYDYPAQTAFYRANYDLMTNLRPFATILLYVRALKYQYIGSTIPLANLLGNVVLFMPMAFFLPCLYAQMQKLWRFLLLMTVLLAAVEALQLVLCCGSCDVDDVILNLAGTLLLYGVVSLPPVKRLLTKLYLMEPDATACLAEPDAPRGDLV